MTWMYGDDYEYAGTRLNGTVIRLGSVPIRIERITEDGTASYVVLATGEQSSVDVRELNLRPVPLGYVNQAGIAGFLCRMPMRNDWRQGLRQESMVVLGQRLNKHRINDVALHKTIVGDYPTIDKCLALLEMNIASSVAWHRHWAIVKTVKLAVHYKGEAVGGISKGKVVLNKKHQHLKECLDEACKAMDEPPQAGLY